MSLKRAKREIPPTDRFFTEISREINIVKKQLGAVRNVHKSELASIGFTIYRCFARLQQILLAVIPRISMPEAEHSDSSQLLYELLRSIQ